MSGLELLTGAESSQDQSRISRLQLRTNRRASTSRLTAILSADVVDYTRHMAEDEAGTHDRFTAVFRTVINPRVAECGGRIVKNTGDGFLAVFSSATQAVWCALDTQDAIRASNGCDRGGRRLELRIGINVGDVIVESHDLFGHHVNVAAASKRPPSRVAYWSHSRQLQRFETDGSCLMSWANSGSRTSVSRCAVIV